MKIWQGVGVIAVLLICPAIRAGGGSLSADDIAKIKRVHSKYEEAWLKGDADGSASALYGGLRVAAAARRQSSSRAKKGLNEYWFPRMLRLRRLPDWWSRRKVLAATPRSRTHGARTRWPGPLSKNGKTTSAAHKGMFLNVLRKQANGEWKVSHHMWDDLVEKH